MSKIPSAVLGHLQRVRATDHRLESVVEECQTMMESLRVDMNTLRYTVTLYRTPIHKMIPFRVGSDLETFFKVRGNINNLESISN